MKERLGIMDEIAAAGLDDMDGYEVLGEQHLINLNGRASREQDISKGFLSGCEGTEFITGNRPERKAGEYRGGDISGRGI